MLFDWNLSFDIDLVNVWDMNRVFGSGVEMINCDTNPGSDCGSKTTDPWSGDPLTVWDGASGDGDGDGRLGISFVDGPFPGFNGNFNVMGLYAASAGLSY